MNIGCDPVWKDKTLQVFTPRLFDGVRVRHLRRTRVVKLMTTCVCSSGTEDGIHSSRDLAISEVYQPVRHLDFGRDDAGHLCTIDRFCQVHEAATFGIERLTGFDEASDR